jgi:hypothetical protein
MRWWGGALALAVLCMAPAILATAARAAALPPELLTLEQKLAQLKVSSLRFSLEIAIIKAQGGAKPAKRFAFGAADGEVGESPWRSQVNVTSLTRHYSVRTIGDARYESRPKIASRDGGRPWVRWRLSPSERSKASTPLSVSELVKIPIDIAPGMHASLAEALTQAQSVAEVGPATVDGLQVTQFNATLNPGITQTSSPLRPTLGEGSFANDPSPEVGPAQPAPTRTVTLELFFTPGGLPVRTRLTVAAGSTSLMADVDIPAINIPVRVSAPPPRATISRSRLKQLERKRSLREGTPPARDH